MCPNRLFVVPLWLCDDPVRGCVYRLIARIAQGVAPVLATVFDGLGELPACLGHTCFAIGDRASHCLKRSGVFGAHGRADKALVELRRRRLGRCRPNRDHLLDTRQPSALQRLFVVTRLRAGPQ